MPAPKDMFARRRSRGMRPAAGFTLLELIVVVTLLAGITMMVVPLYGQSFTSLESRNTRNSLMALINFVQQRAVVDSREYRIYFDADERAFWVMVDGGMEDDERVFEEVLEPYGRRQHLAQHQQFKTLPKKKDRDRNAQYLAFYPNGACDRATISVIDARSRRGNFSIETLGALGKVELKES